MQTDLKWRMRQQWLKTRLTVLVRCEGCHKDVVCVCDKKEYHDGYATLQCECGDKNPKPILKLIRVGDEA